MAHAPEPYPFEHINNFRDLAGTPCAGGRVIKPCVLLRSGAIHGATKDDCQVLLNEYHLSAVIDLRNHNETFENPDPARYLPGVDMREAPVLGAIAMGVSRDSKSLRAMAKMAKELKRDPGSIMLNMYGKIPLDPECQEGYRLFFRTVIGNKRGATLWHCTAGKDRAGIATMLLLAALGASKETVLDDYVETNKHMDEEGTLIREALARYHMEKKLDASVEAMNAADPRYLSATYEAIEAAYGSTDSYLDQVLAIGPEIREALQERFLA